MCMYSLELDIRGSPYKVVVLIWFLLDTCDILAADPIA